MKFVIAAAAVLLSFFATVRVVEGRDLSVTVVGGDVEVKDTFTTDAYMSVSVCKEKERTPTVSSSNHPTWNWTHRVIFSLTDFHSSKIAICKRVIQLKSRQSVGM
jgi:hypothetical protein